MRRQQDVLAAALGLMLVAGCRVPTTAPVHPAEQPRVRIGFSLDTLREERWQRDRDMFVLQARSLGADVVVLAAANDDALQLAQAESMIRQGVDVLVVAPHDAEKMAPVVDLAHAAGIPVLAYDRLINNADVDFYISFDCERVGELQAEYLTGLVPKGSYVLVDGAYTDNNARLYRSGAWKVLQPLVDQGLIQVISDEYTYDWLPGEAEAHVARVLETTGGRIDAVLAANDGTASGAVAALEGWQLAGKVPVSGQDAELAALQRIVAGTQSMTVYKPIKRLAEQAVAVALAMARDETPVGNAEMYNGKRNVPALLLEPIPVARDNIMETIVKSGFHRMEDIYRDVPRSEWPTSN